MTHFNTYKICLLLLISILVLPIGAVLADTLNADVVQADIIGDPNTNNGGQTSFGEIIQVLYWVVANSAGGDTEAGCNATPSSPLVVTPSVPSGLAASPTSVTITGCGTANGKVVSFTASEVGDYTVPVTILDSGPGKYNIAPATVFLDYIDDTPPTIDPHDDVTAEATGPGGAAVTYDSPATHDAVDGDGTATCTPPSGSTFALGHTTVECNATDAAGNSASSFFDVFVDDTTPPNLTLPTDMTVQATSSSGAVVTFSASATDIVDPAPVVVCTPASGSTFTVGTTTVNCTATDASGNSASGSFNITVNAFTKVTFGGGVSPSKTSVASGNVKYDGSRYTGSLEFQDKTANINLKATNSFTSLEISADGKTATFSGTATKNKQPGYTFTVTVVDNGEPGKNDTFAITIKDPSGNVIYSKAAAKIIKGNIQVHV